MAKIAEILDLVRGFAAEDATEPDFADNVGLLVGSAKGETEKVVLCLDCTESVVREAATLGARLVISHHPVIFHPLKSVTDDDPTGRTVLAAARAGITVYSAHTNLDFCPRGINDYAAELLGLTNVTALEDVGGVRVGRIGTRNRTTLKQLAEKAAKDFDDGHIRLIGDPNAEVRTVAVLNGGGGSIGNVRAAQEKGADCYVTADVPHHVALYAAESGLPLMIMQHYAMEAVYKKRFAEILFGLAKSRGIEATFVASKAEKNPAWQEVL